MNKRNIIQIIFLMINSVIIFLLFKYFSEAFNQVLKIVIIIGFIVFATGLIYEKNSISFLGYIIILFGILFIRKRANIAYTDTSYFKDWYKIIFSNRIVFINVLGNLILYIPLILYLQLFIKNKIIALFITIIWIILGELLQYIFHLGVFDFLDICLNIFGVIVVLLIKEVVLWMKRKKMKKRKK